MAEEAGAKADLLLSLSSSTRCRALRTASGVSMIEDLESRGLIKQGTTLIEPTSGNTGIALPSSPPPKVTSSFS